MYEHMIRAELDQAEMHLPRGMLDALGVLGRIRTRALEASEMTHAGLGSAGAELDLEVKAYTEGLREVAELVKTDDRQ